MFCLIVDTQDQAGSVSQELTKLFGTDQCLIFYYPAHHWSFCVSKLSVSYDAAVCRPTRVRLLLCHKKLHRAVLFLSHTTIIAAHRLRSDARVPPCSSRIIARHTLSPIHCRVTRPTIKIDRVCALKAPAMVANRAQMTRGHITVCLKVKKISQ